MASKVLANLYYVAVVVANDMKHVHTHAKGHRFDRIHSICNEYYERAKMLTLWLSWPSSTTNLSRMVPWQQVFSATGPPTRPSTTGTER